MNDHHRTNQPAQQPNKATTPAPRQKANRPTRTYVTPEDGYAILGVSSADQPPF